MRKFALAAIAAGIAWVFVPSAGTVAAQYSRLTPMVTSCSPPTNDCKASRASYMRDYERALKADLNAMRSVAHCLKTGCLSAVHVDEVASCAWRKLVILEHPAKATDHDRDLADKRCNRDLPYATDRHIAEQLVLDFSRLRKTK